MPSPVVRRIVVSAVALALFIAAIVAAIPYFAATQLVRDRIAWELSMWSGYRVTLGSAPKIDIWPVFRADLANVTFSRWGGDPQPVIHADRLEADLSAFAALHGDVVFTGVKLTRPTFHVWPASLAAPGIAAAGGRFGEAIAKARALVEANPTAPDASKLPSGAVGTIEFVDGRMALHADGRDTEVLSNVSGTLDWPAFNRTATLTATGIWRGELMSITASSEQPLFLAAGGSAPLSVTVESAPVSGAFQGIANTSGATYFNGDLRLASPSMRRMLEWSRTDISPGASVGSFTLRGQVSGAINRLKVANATLVLDNNQGTGTLEMALWEPVPSIAGTLAFDTIDLQSFLSAFSALTPDGVGRYRTVDSKIGDQVSLDLRLSAARATAGRISFTDVAATAQVKAGLAAFDISDATAFDGTIQAGMRVDRQGEEAGVEVRLRGTNIDMGALAKAIEVNQLVPISRANFLIALKGMGEDIGDVLGSANGTISASFGRGAMAGVDIAKFTQRARSGEFFALQEVGNGTLAFNSVEVKASVKEGIARVEKADLDTASGLLTLRGIVPLPGRGLALAGRLDRTANPRDDQISFFVGGSWDAPYISPILPGIERP